jgi:putative transposase
MSSGGNGTPADPLPALLELAGEWPTYGYRRLTFMMRRLGWPVNGKRVRRWMDELDIHGAPPAR